MIKLSEALQGWKLQWHCIENGVYLLVYFWGESISWKRNKKVSNVKSGSRLCLVVSICSHAILLLRDIPLVTEILVLGDISLTFLAGHVVPNSSILPGVAH